MKFFTSRRLLYIFWIMVLIPFISLFLIFVLINMEFFGDLPDFEELENPKTAIATEIYSADSVLMGKFFKENRTVVEFKDVSPNVLNALIATEDVRFYEHSGIDGIALARVIIYGGGRGGGSTVTQQLAKNLYKIRSDSSNYKTGLSGKANLVMSKLKEWVTAVKLERSYTKQEILAMYLNTVDFGSNAFGIKSAAKTFFDKTPSQLTIEEAAVIIGTLKAPTKYSPKLNPKNSLRRRNDVLNQIKKYQNKLSNLNGYKIRDEAYYDSLKSIPINLNYSVQSHKLGNAKYFREYLRIIMTKKEPKKKNYSSWNMEKYEEDRYEWSNNPLYGWCNKNLKPDGTPYNLYRDGLKIYSTVDSRMQKYAEAAVKEHMSKTIQPLFYKRKTSKKAPFSWKLSYKQIDNIMYASMKRSERYRVLKAKKLDSTQIRKIFNTPTKMKVFSWKGEIDTLMTPWDSIRYYKYFLNAGLMSVDPQNGYVKAYVGGIDYNHFRYDHVTLSKRQVGSTIKPILYSVAMEDGLSPNHMVPNIPVTFEKEKFDLPKDYTPQYSRNKRRGQMIPLSYGLANSLNQTSAWIIKKYGPKEVIKMARRLGIKSKLEEVYSLCVGAADLRLSEMVAAYTTFPNKGMQVDPIFVVNIFDKNGNEIVNFTAKKNEALDESTAYKMIQLMRGVVDSGTSTRIRYKYKLNNQIAGKTGTTNDNSDGWFIGYVPNLVTGVWVGGEERSIRFSNTGDGQGATLALPIWALYMQKVYKDNELSVSNENFEKPHNYEESQSIRVDDDIDVY